MSLRAPALGALLLALAACSSASSGGAPAIAGLAGTGGAAGAAGAGAAGGAKTTSLDLPVDQVGPFHVGYRTWKITYTPPLPGAAPRTIPLGVWYPTNDATGDHPHYKFVVDTEAIVDASRAPPLEPAGYPVHVYSHGYAGFGGTSHDLMHYFASHGWVAIAPDHVGNTFPDDPKNLPPALWLERSWDIKASLDALETLAQDDPLSARTRTKHVLMSGHSFGTFTTWATSGATLDPASVAAKCSDGKTFAAPCTADEQAAFATLADPRIIAGVPMAGGDTGFFGAKGAGYSGAGKPMMLLSGTDDNSPAAQALFGLVTTIDFTWLDFAGGCHQLFALGGCPMFDEQEGWALVRTYVLAFARRHVLGDTSARVAHLLDGTESLSPKVAFHHEGAAP